MDENLRIEAEMEQMFRNNPDRPYYKPETDRFVVVPRQIFYNPNISPTEKLFLGLVYSLTKHESPCFASNGFLASSISVSEKRIANMVAELKSRGYIELINSSIRFRTMKCTLKED